MYAIKMVKFGQKRKTNEKLNNLITKKILERDLLETNWKKGEKKLKIREQQCTY